MKTKTVIHIEDEIVEHRPVWSKLKSTIKRSLSVEQRLNFATSKAHEEVEEDTGNVLARHQSYTWEKDDSGQCTIMIWSFRDSNIAKEYFSGQKKLNGQKVVPKSGDCLFVLDTRDTQRAQVIHDNVSVVADFIVDPLSELRIFTSYEDELFESIAIKSGQLADGQIFNDTDIPMIKVPLEWGIDPEQKLFLKSLIHRKGAASDLIEFFLSRLLDSEMLSPSVMVQRREL